MSSAKVDGPLSSAPGRALRILIIEDNAADAEFVHSNLRGLRGQDFELAWVETVAEGHECLSEHSFDVVLLDLGLPDSEGLEGLERLRAAYRHMPIIVLTGIADERVGVRALRAGAEDFLEKGTHDGRALSRCLRHAIERARQRAQLEAVIEHSMDAMVVTDEDGAICFVNAVAMRLFGDRREALARAGLGPRSEQQDDEEREIVTRSGDIRIVRTRREPITWYGREAQLLSLRDITDERRREELERRLAHADRLASIGQLAAGVAHEVNNPAAAVVLNLSMLRDTVIASGSLDERRELAVQLAQESLEGMERIRRIVQDLRSFARRDAEEVEWVQLNDLVTAACNITSNEVRHRARLEKDLGEVPYIAGRPSKLGQVLVNLIINAAQAIGTGHGDDYVRVTTRTEGEYIVVSVEDTGVGIPPEVGLRVFEPFFTTKPRDIGTGLGLAIAAQIIEEHGGTIGFSGREGGGTRFDIRVPERTGLVVAENEMLMPSSHGLARRARVLVVDDEEPVLRALNRALRNDHDIVLAHGGLEAERLIRAEQQGFDLVLCDLVMPDIDGGELFKRVTKFAPDVARRFVFVSGGAFTEPTRDFAMTSGQRFLEKPVDPKTLQEVIADAVAARPVGGLLP